MHPPFSSNLRNVRCFEAKEETSQLRMFCALKFLLDTFFQSAAQCEKKEHCTCKEKAVSKPQVEVSMFGNCHLELRTTNSHFFSCTTFNLRRGFYRSLFPQRRNGTVLTIRRRRHRRMNRKLSRTSRLPITCPLPMLGIAN